MQLFDMKWKLTLEAPGVKLWLMARYMDDVRVFLPPIKPGWRGGMEGRTRGIWFKKEWETEDSCLSPTEITKRALEFTMQNVEFTMESGEDFDGGWLPTLDTSLKIGSNNRIMYKFYKKEVSSKRTVQAKTAMEENVKHQIVANDLVRRLLNTSEELGAEYRGAVVDQYAQELSYSGYSMEQIRKVIVNGIQNFSHVCICLDLQVHLYKASSKR